MGKFLQKAHKIALVFMIALAFAVTGCNSSSSSNNSGGSDSGSDSNGGNPDDDGNDLVEIDPELPEKLVAEIIATWLGIEHSPFGNGYTDSNFSGNPDTYDSVNIIESLKALGYDIPETTIQGLHNNYYTEGGYDIRNEDLYDKEGFTYTIASEMNEDDVKNGSWELLEFADLIFIDYNNDLYWNNAAIYIGQYDGYTHAAITASDYYGETLIVDLENDNVINLDILYGYSDVRKLAFENFAHYYNP